MTTLRSKVIRLAHANPELRPHLLPLLKEAGGTPDAKATAKQVAEALAKVFGGAPDVSDDFLDVGAGYRSEALRSTIHGGRTYHDETVRKEILRVKSLVERALTQYKDRVKEIRVDEGEKGWLDITVSLK